MKIFFQNSGHLIGSDSRIQQRSRIGPARTSKFRPTLRGERFSENTKIFDIFPKNSFSKFSILLNLEEGKGEVDNLTAR